MWGDKQLDKSSQRQIELIKAEGPSKGIKAYGYAFCHSMS